jgi:hypothetical protein
MEFDLTAQWNNKTKKLEWKSKYLKTHIDKWQGFSSGQNINDTDRTLRKKLHDDIADDFLFKFPVVPMFIPASRAVASVIADARNIHIADTFLLNFINDIKTSLGTISYESDVYIEKLLHINKIKIENNTMLLKSTDERIVTPLELSSGQQGLIYLILFISNIDDVAVFRGEGRNPVIIFNNNKSVFIEEPSAHLFPQEQKDTIEYFVKTFREFRDNKKINIRFFITTHSPYILDVINNMLKKGILLKRNKERAAEINTAVNFPHLFIEELSAIFIEDGMNKNMFLEKEDYLSADKIAKISFSINDDTNILANLNNRFMAIKGS